MIVLACFIEILIGTTSYSFCFIFMVCGILQYCIFLTHDAAMLAQSWESWFCPSVWHTCALWLIQRTYRQYFYSTWKGSPS